MAENSSTTLTATLAQLAREQAFMDVEDVAAALCVTRWWVCQLIARGERRAINVGGYEKAARWRVDPEGLSAWMRMRENRPRDLMVS